MVRAWRNSRYRRLIVHLMALYEMLARELRVDDVYRAVLEVVRAVTGAERVSLQLLDGTGQHLVLVAGEGLPLGMPLGETCGADGGIAGWVLMHRRPLLLTGTTHADPDVQQRLRLVSGQSALCVPLLVKGRPLGVLSASTFGAARPFDHIDLEFLSRLASQVAIAVSHAQVHQETLRLATTDGLTGLLNRRAFDERLASELDRAGRTEGQLTLLALDLDRLKLINDCYGHLAGDRLLRLVAHEAIAASIRPSDAAARTGGDEFAVLLPDTSRDEGEAVAARIARVVQTLDYASWGLPAHVAGVSLGIAHFPSESASGQQLRQLADERLYRAKSRATRATGCPSDGG